MNTKLFWYGAKVTHVIDGATVRLNIDQGLDVSRKITLRLHKVNTPEIFGVDKESDEYARGMEAKKFTEERLLDKRVWVHTYRDRRGKNGNYTADIFFQDDDGRHVSVSKLLLEDGLAAEAEY